MNKNMQKQPLGFFSRAIATLVGSALLTAVLVLLLQQAVGHTFGFPIWGIFFVCLLCVAGPNLAKLIIYSILK